MFRYVMERFIVVHIYDDSNQGNKQRAAIIIRLSNLFFPTYCSFLVIALFR